MFSGRAASTARTRRAQQPFNSEQVAKNFGGARGMKCSATLHGAVREFSKRGEISAWVAQLVERVLGKDEVTG